MRVAVAIAPLAAVLAGLTGCGSGAGGTTVAAAASAETVGTTAGATGTTGSRSTAPSPPTTTAVTAAAPTTTTATTAARTDPQAGATAVVLAQPAPPSTAPPSTAPPSTAPPSSAPPSTAAPAPAPEAEAEAAGPLPSSGPSSPEAARAWELLNGLRRSEGLAALVPTGDAMAKAEALAERMAADGRLSHSPSPFEGLDDRWQVAVENVGVGTSADHVHQLLEADRPHRDNMVDPRVTAGGIGAAWGADGRLYVAQVLVG